MVPGIDPKVDYAFQRLFGREANQALAIHLLNAVLTPPPHERVVDLQFLNPFNDKDTLDDKLSILDIKARDQSGRQFNVEMQLLANRYFRQRVPYYWARLHQSQLQEGQEYRVLRPTISICFVNTPLFPRCWPIIWSLNCGNGNTRCASPRTWRCICWSCPSSRSWPRNWLRPWMCGYTFCGMANSSTPKPCRRRWPRSRKYIERWENYK